MNEAEAWREIARLLSTGEPFLGLCGKVSTLWNSRKIISATIFWRMLDRCDMHVLELCNGSSYAYPSGEEREARILAALWMAHEAEEEEKGSTR